MSQYNFHSIAIIDSLSYIIGAFLLVFIHISSEKNNPSNDISLHSNSSFWSDWVDGLRYVKNNPVLRPLFTVLGLAFLGDSIFGILLVPYVEDIVGAGVTGYGLIATVRGLSGIIGGLIITQALKQVSYQRSISIGLLLTGILLGGMIITTNMLVILASVSLIGPPVIAWQVSTQTTIQETSLDNIRGRVFGLYSTFNASMMIVGVFASSFLSETISIVYAMTLASLIYCAAGIIGYFILSRIEEDEKAFS